MEPVIELRHPQNRNAPDNGTSARSVDDPDMVEIPLPREDGTNETDTPFALRETWPRPSKYL